MRSPYPATNNTLRSVYREQTALGGQRSDKALVVSPLVLRTLPEVGGVTTDIS